MRKFFLTFIFIVLTLTSASISNAECVVIEDTYLYYDAERYFKVARVCAMNVQQGALMVLSDVNSGDAVFMPRGTSVDNIKPVPNCPGACVVKKGNLLLMGLTKDIKCN